MQSLLILMSLFNMYQVIWSNTVIEIPLGESVHEYTLLPDATLNLDGNVINNDAYYYERGVNRTSLSVVNSNVVKEFKIDYRITFYDLAITSEQTITFKIVDKISPTILKVPTFAVPVNSKMPSEKTLLEGLYYEDNYYSNEALVVKINGLYNINPNRVGIYEIEYEIMDPSYNISKQTTTYEVYDQIYPKIIYDSNIKHPFGKVFNVDDYFTFIGDDLAIEVNTSNVNFDVLGSYPINVSATNLSGLSTTINPIINIVDLTPPKIILKSMISDLNVFDENYNLLDYVLSVSDNYDKLAISDITYLTDLNINEIGKYFVTYTLTDFSNNETSIKIYVNVKDLVKPTIKAIKPLVFNIDDEIPYYYHYFNINDNYNSLDDLSITFNDKSINYQKLGNYYLEVSVKDTSGNLKKESFLVLIKDLKAPEVEQKAALLVYDFKRPSASEIKSKFLITDNFDPYLEIEVEVIDNLVNYEKVGAYNITLIFSDQSNNQTTEVTTIYLIDNEPPVITLKEPFYFHFIGDIKKPLKDFILTISDNYSKLTNTDVVIEHNINFDEVGKYEVIYQISDSSNNEAIEKLTFYVDIRREALITGHDLSLDINNNWQLLDGIKLSDHANKYEVFYNFNKLDHPGKYEVMYIAYDKRQNFDIYKQQITVFNVIKPFNYYKLSYATIITFSYFTYLGFNVLKERKNAKKYFDNDI